MNERKPTTEDTLNTWRNEARELRLEIQKVSDALQEQAHKADDLFLKVQGAIGAFQEIADELNKADRLLDYDQNAEEALVHVRRAATFIPDALDQAS
jgi:predicted HTH domain antitoxin